MTDEQLLLRAIIMHPDEDTPRLVYADWLDEHATTDAQRGRAEFIRLQCRLAATPPDDPERDAAYARADELRQQHVAEWAAFVYGRGVYGGMFRRGFVEEVAATAHAFTTRGRVWSEQTPLRTARLWYVAGREDRLAAVPHLSVLTELVIEDGAFGDDGLAELADSPYLGGLRDFSILGHPDRSTRVSDQGVCALAATPLLSQLTRLTLRGWYGLSSLGLTALAECGRLGLLRELCLEHTTIDDRGAVALSAAECPALETVSICASRIGNDGFVALATSSRLRELSDLQLRRGRINGFALTTLARRAERLRCWHIDLRGNPLGGVDPSAVADLLAANPGLGLDLSACDLPQALQEHLLRRFRGRVIVDPR